MTSVGVKELMLTVLLWSVLSTMFWVGIVYGVEGQIADRMVIEMEKREIMCNYCKGEK